VVLRLFPEALLIGGGGSDSDFHYDFFIPQFPDETFLSIIEEHLRALIKSDFPIHLREMMRENAVELFHHQRQEIRAEAIAECPDNIVSIFQVEDFYDFCPLPYPHTTNEVGVVKLLDLKQFTMFFEEEAITCTRISGTAFPDLQSLKKFLKILDKAKKRDHLLLTDMLNIGSCSEQGFVVWHSKGESLREVLVELWKGAHKMDFFQFVSTMPLISKEMIRNVEDTSLLPPIMIDGREFVLNPQPGLAHALLYQAMPHFQWEHPIRFAEMSRYFPNEKFERLNGWLNTRVYWEDTETIFCTPDQVVQELISSLQFIDKIVKIFGIEHRWQLSVPGSKDKGYAKWLIHALQSCRIEYLRDDRRAFRLELGILDARGRKWKGPYIEILDELPKRLNLRYEGVDKSWHNPVMIHRSLFGPLERFVAILIEHYAGEFPLWVAPEQMRVVPVEKRNIDYAMTVQRECLKNGIRTGIDRSEDKLSAKVHRAETEKIPYMLVVGDKEEQQKKVAIRAYNRKKGHHRIGLETFLLQVQSEIEASKKREKIA
jgi:threonyl-tRNA synthetase